MRAVLCGAAWVNMGHRACSEWGLVTRLFLQGPFRRIIDLQARLEELERSLAKAGSLEDCWETIQVGCREFGFQGSRLSVCGRVFEDGPPAGRSGQWHLRIPLAASQYVNLYRDPDAEDHPAVVARFANILRNGLQARIDERQDVTPV